MKKYLFAFTILALSAQTQSFAQQPGTMEDGYATAMADSTQRTPKTVTLRRTEKIVNGLRVVETVQGWSTDTTAAQRAIFDAAEINLGHGFLAVSTENGDLHCKTSKWVHSISIEYYLQPNGGMLASIYVLAHKPHRWWRAYHGWQHARARF